MSITVFQCSIKYIAKQKPGVITQALRPLAIPHDHNNNATTKATLGQGVNRDGRVPSSQSKPTSLFQDRLYNQLAPLLGVRRTDSNYFVVASDC